MQSLQMILYESSKRHKPLCLRQVLGARMSFLAAEILELELPGVDKRSLVIAETDGCTVDGFIAATGCRVGRNHVHFNIDLMATKNHQPMRSTVRKF